MYPLLVLRDNIALKEVLGSVDRSISSEGTIKDFFKSNPGKFVRPLMKHREGVIPGILSGRRSALTVVHGLQEPIVMKYKGSGDLDHIVNTDEDYAGEPMGGQSLTYATNDIKATKIIGDLFGDQEGLQSPLIPLGVVTYDGFEQCGEKCAAGVYQAFGDTRIDELVSLLLGTAIERNWLDKPKFNKHAESLMKDIGTYCGSLMNLLYRNGLIWGTRMNGSHVLSNAHAGNFVLTPYDGQLRVGMVDFDSGALAEILAGENTSDFKRMTDYMTQERISEGQAIFNTVQSRLATGKFGSIPRKYIQFAEYVFLASSFSDYIMFTDPKTEKTVTPDSWLKCYLDGFNQGFSIPCFKPIPYDYDKLIAEVTRALTEVSSDSMKLYDLLADLAIYKNGYKKYANKNLIDYKSLVDNDFKRHSIYKSFQDDLFGYKSKLNCYNGLDSLDKYMGNIYNKKEKDYFLDNDY